MARTATSPQRSATPGARHLGGIDRWAAAEALVRRRLIVRIAPIAVLVLVLAVVALVVGVAWWLVLIVVALGAGALVMWALQLAALDPMEHVRPLVPGSPAHAPDDARVLNMVENLAFAVGTPVPEVLVLDSPAANAMVAQGNNGAVLCATRGLTDQLDLMELEAVIAVLLGRLRHGDARLATTATALVSPERRGDVLGSDRVIGFDIEGVSLTRYPPGLARAFERLAGMATEVDAPDALDWFWLVPPPRLESEGSLDVRAAVMHEL